MVVQPNGENGTMADLNREIEAYEGLKIKLEEQHAGKWVVVHDCEVAGVYADMESAAEEILGQEIRKGSVPASPDWCASHSFARVCDVRSPS